MAKAQKKKEDKKTPKKASQTFHDIMKASVSNGGKPHTKNNETKRTN